MEDDKYLELRKEIDELKKMVDELKSMIPLKKCPTGDDIDFVSMPNPLPMTQDLADGIDYCEFCPLDSLIIHKEQNSDGMTLLRCSICNKIFEKRDEDGEYSIIPSMQPTYELPSEAPLDIEPWKV